MICSRHELHQAKICANGRKELRSDIWSVPVRRYAVIAVGMTQQSMVTVPTCHDLFLAIRRAHVRLEYRSVMTRTNRYPRSMSGIGPTMAIATISTSPGAGKRRKGFWFVCCVFIPHAIAQPELVDELVYFVGHLRREKVVPHRIIHASRPRVTRCHQGVLQDHQALTESHWHYPCFSARYREADD